MSHSETLDGCFARSSFLISTDLSRTMTTKVAEFESERRMHDQLTWEQFTQKFREAFGREMTPDECHWFHSMWAQTTAQKQDKAKGAAA